MFFWYFGKPWIYQIITFWRSGKLHKWIHLVLGFYASGFYFFLIIISMFFSWLFRKLTSCWFLGSNMTLRIDPFFSFIQISDLVLFTVTLCDLLSLRDICFTFSLSTSDLKIPKITINFLDHFYSFRNNLFTQDFEYNISFPPHYFSFYRKIWWEFCWSFVFLSTIYLSVILFVFTLFGTLCLLL